MPDGDRCGLDQAFTAQLVALYCSSSASRRRARLCRATRFANNLDALKRLPELIRTHAGM